LWMWRALMIIVWGGEGMAHGTLTWFPQYSQVMTAAPGVGAMGAPQLGHLVGAAA